MKHVDHGYDVEVLNVLQELARSHGNSKPLHFQPPGDYMLDGVRFHSRPEAACGYLLSKYHREFELIAGRTFQVPVGVGSGGDLQTVDFRFGEVFIEYHPPRIHQHAPFRKGGRKSGRAEPRELRRLRSMLRKPNLPRHVRDRTYARLRGYLTRRYFEDRMAVLSNSPVVNDFTLLVLGSPEELYRDFLEPFGGDRRLPSLRSFVGEFKGLLKAVSDVRRKAA